MRLLPVLPWVVGFASQAFAADVAIRGDVDGDRVINLRDLLALRQHLDGSLALPPDALARADVTLDGAVSEADYEALTLPAVDGNPAAPFQAPGEDVPHIVAVSPPFAQPGDLITLSGDGFAACASAVRFGDTALDVLLATATQVVARVAPGSGHLFVTNLVTGRTSAGRSFVVSATEQPQSDPAAPLGEVLLGMPGEVPLPNSQFTVAVAVRAAAAAIGSIGVSLRYDPDHVRAVHVVPTHPDFLTPMPPCIDNASGLLGSGALRSSKLLISLPSADPLPLFRIVFECVNYRAEMPHLTGRVECVADAAFPADPIGAPGPRYAARTTALFAPPKLHSVGIPLGAPAPAELPTITKVVPPNPKQSLVLKMDNVPQTGVVIFGQKVAVPEALSASGVTVMVPPGARSGPVMVLNTQQGTLSNASMLVIAEAVPPALSALAPLPGTSIAQNGDLLLLFSEVIDAQSLMGDGVQVQVSGGMLPPRSVAITTNVLPFGQTLVRIRPLLPYPSGSTVTLLLGSAIRDLSGNALQPVAFSYSVAAD